MAPRPGDVLEVHAPDLDSRPDEGHKTQMSGHAPRRAVWRSLFRDRRGYLLTVLVSGGVSECASMEEEKEVMVLGKQDTKRRESRRPQAPKSTYLLTAMISIRSASAAPCSYLCRKRWNVGTLAAADCDRQSRAAVAFFSPPILTRLRHSRISVFSESISHIRVCWSLCLPQRCVKGSNPVY